jgi:hypothetical protein
MTGDWRSLPPALDPELAYLVGILRELKDRSGRSLETLAVETAVSKSSWQRYLNGAKLPPRYAVEALARLAGEPAERPLALWQQAEAAWSRRAVDAAPAPDPALASDPEPGPAPVVRRRGRRWIVVAALGILVVAAAVAGLVARRPDRAAPVSANAAAPPPFSVTVGCHAAGCAGRDPLDMDCSVDAASYAVLRVAGALLELRISDRCQAGWARVSHAHAGERVQVTGRDGSTQSALIGGPAGTSQYLPTRMIGAVQHGGLRACLVARNGTRRWCTPPGADHQVDVPAP